MLSVLKAVGAAEIKWAGSGSTLVRVLQLITCMQGEAWDRVSLADTPSDQVFTMWVRVGCYDNSYVNTHLSVTLL